MTTWVDQNENLLSGIVMIRYSRVTISTFISILLINERVACFAQNCIQTRLQQVKSETNSEHALD